MQHQRSKSWTFTLNNFLEYGYPEFETMQKEGKFEYYCWQEEIGEEGTPHLQGYIRFTAPRTFGIVKELLQHAHIERAKGTARQNKEYCTKEETRIPGTEPVEYGECPEDPGQGKRMDIVALRNAIAEGSSFKDIIMTDTLLPTAARHMNFVNRALQELSVPIHRPDIQVTFCFGPSGTGKSTCAGLFDPEIDSYAYDAVGSGRFWDGYSNQTVLILDEFSGHVCTPLQFNRICDKGPLKVDIKNGSHWANFRDIRITSNYLPNQWWRDGTQYNTAAIARRIHLCHYHPEIGQCEIFNSDGAPALVKMEMSLRERGIN